MLRNVKHIAPPTTNPNQPKENMKKSKENSQKMCSQINNPPECNLVMTEKLFFEKKNT